MDWNFGEGKSREWTVAFGEGGLGSVESKVKIWRLCWL